MKKAVLKKMQGMSLLRKFFFYFAYVKVYYINVEIPSTC